MGNKKPLVNSSGLLFVIISSFLTAILLATVVLWLLVGPFAVLPATAPNASKNTTQTIGVVTQSGEISKIASLLLTVEGILLGLSPILFGRLRILGASTVTVTASGLISSLLTVLFADTGAFTNVIVLSYFVDILLFIAVVITYIVSSWYLALQKKEELDRTG